MFLGDGMGITTTTAGRIFKGQLNGKTGEETITNMQSLDDVALSIVREQFYFYAYTSNTDEFICFIIITSIFYVREHKKLNYI